MAKIRILPGQLALPGMASHCPHCGSHAVAPATMGEDQDDVSANEWHCRRCDRTWWQMAKAPAATA